MEVNNIVLMGIFGELGSGKTLALTYFALRNYYKGRDIFANYKLVGIPFTPVQTSDDITNMREGFFAGDR